MIRKYVITSAGYECSKTWKQILKNAKMCRPRSDLGRDFFGDLNFDGFRGLKFLKFFTAIKKIKFKVCILNTDWLVVNIRWFSLAVDKSAITALEAASFTVRSTPDFRNTNWIEPKTVTWLLWLPLLKSRGIQNIHVTVRIVMWPLLVRFN
jgi:hypothetical protein